MRKGSMGRFGLAAAMIAALATPAFALSDDAQKIVDAVKAATPVLKPVCSDRGKLTAAVTSAATALAKSGAIPRDEEKARAAGMEAGRYLYFNCS